MKKIIATILASSALLLVALGSASALTLKSGQVLGADGKVHDGASPQVQANLVKNAKRTGDAVGVSGTNVYVVVGDVVTYVPISKVQGKSKAAMVSIVGDAVAAKVTGVQGLTLQEIQAISTETGIAADNVALVNKIASNFSADVAKDMIDGIQDAVDNGLVSQVNDFFSNLSANEIGLLSQFTSLEDCQAAGGSGCEAMDAKLDAMEGGN